MEEAERPAEPAELRRLAYAAWRVAGDLGDGPARRHYLAHASHDTPAEAYRAGWTSVRWNSFLTLTGWATVIANYGAAERWRQPLHLGVWAVLLLGLLVLGFKGLLSKPKIMKAGSPERSRRPTPAAPSKAKTGGKAADETLLPDTMVTPRKRDRALSDAEATRLPSATGDQPDEEPDDTDTYLPEEAPPGKRAAVSDIAKRLAKDRDDQRGGRPSPRRRR